MASSLRKIFEALNQKELLVWRDSILQNSDAVEEDECPGLFKTYFSKRETRRKRKIGENRTFKLVTKILIKHSTKNKLNKNT